MINYLDATYFFQGNEKQFVAAWVDKINNAIMTLKDQSIEAVKDVASKSIDLQQGKLPKPRKTKSSDPQPPKKGILKSDRKESQESRTTSFPEAPPSDKEILIISNEERNSFVSSESLEKIELEQVQVLDRDIEREKSDDEVRALEDEEYNMWLRKSASATFVKVWLILF